MHGWCFSGVHCGNTYKYSLCIMTRLDVVIHVFYVQLTAIKLE